MARARVPVFAMAVLLSAAATLGLSSCVNDTVAVNPTVAATGSPLPDDTSTIIPQPVAAQATASITVSGTNAAGDTVSASGMVDGLIEDGGVCSYVFTNGTATLAASHEGLANVSYTSCGIVDLPRSDFAAGEWTVTVSYTSPDQTTVVSPSSPVELS